MADKAEKYTEKTPLQRVTDFSPARELVSLGEKIDGASYDQRYNPETKSFETYRSPGRLEGKIDAAGEEAYKKLQEALAQGQDALDRLPAEVKSMAMGPAEDSLGGWKQPPWSDISDPSSEGFYQSVDPIVSPPDDFKLVFDTKNPQSDYYQERSDLPPRPADELVAPDPGARKKYESRESYKGFRMPKGLEKEQIDAWKEGVDDRLLEEDERLQERIESAHPADQMKDLLRRASEGDLEAIKDIGYFGLNVASMSPIGQLGQAAADVGVGGMDLAEGDYTGAAISGAAVLLPVTAAMLKGAITNPTAAKLVSKLDDVEPLERAAPGDPNAYMEHLALKGFSDDVAKLSDDELAEAYKSLGRANIAIRKGPQRSVRSGKAQELVGNREMGPAPEYTPAESFAETDALDSIDEAYARTYATKELLKEEVIKRIGGDRIKHRQWTKKLITPRNQLVQKQAAVDKSLSDALNSMKYFEPPPSAISKELEKQILRGDFGSEAKSLLTGVGDSNYNIEQALLKSGGTMSPGVAEEVDFKKYLEGKVLEAIPEASATRLSGKGAEKMQETSKEAPFYTSPPTAVGIPLKVQEEFMSGKHGDKARDFLIGANDTAVKIEDELRKSGGKVTDAVKELQEFRDWQVSQVYVAGKEEGTWLPGIAGNW